MFESVSLREVAADHGLVGGPFGSSLTGKDYTESGVPVIRGGNMGPGNSVSGEFAFVSVGKYENELSRNSAVPGDLVFTQRGTLGQVAIVPETPYPVYVVSQSQMRLRVDKSRYDRRFVLYACATSHFEQQIRDNAIATGLPHINLGILTRLTIPSPPLLEQRAIAEVLGALDDKIAANRRVVATCEGLSIALAATGRDLRQLADIASRQVESVNPASFGDARVDLFSLPAFDEGRRPEKVEASIIKSNKVMLRQPCVLLTKLNPRIPRVWDIPELSDRLSLASPEFLALTPNACSSSVLWSVLCQARFLGELSSLVAGTSGSHQRVRPEEVMRLDVTDPASIDPGNRSAINALGTVIVNLRAESRTLAEARDSLLPLLMSGRVRVKDAETTVEGVV